jgi:hypothetical protein
MDKADEEMIYEELRSSCLSLAYSCYPFNPWFFSDFQRIVVSLGVKE